MSNIYLLHGLLGTCYAHFAAQIREWQGVYCLIPIDLPGHGQASQDAERPYFTRAIQLLREQMVWRGAGHVIGVSYLGGSIALHGALSYPELFRSLVLTGYVPQVPAAAISSWANAFFTLAQKNSLLAHQYEKMHGSRWQRTLEVVTSEFREEYSTAIAITESRLASLRVLTLVVNGALKSDERTAAVELPLYNPLIQAGVIPAAGHIACHDQPGIFNLMVKNFWKEVQGQENVTYMA